VSVLFLTCSRINLRHWCSVQVVIRSVKFNYLLLVMFVRHVHCRYSVIFTPLKFTVL